MTDPRRANLYLAVTILLWSTVASAFKLTLRTLPVPDLLLLASLISALALWILLLSTQGVAAVRGQSLRQIAGSALQGALNPVLYYLVLFYAYKLLPAQQAQPLNFTWPLMLMLLAAPLLGERITPRKAIALVISYCGVVLVVTRGSFAGLEAIDGTGVALALGSTVVWALFWMFNLRDRRHDLLKLAMAFSWGTLYLIVIVLLRGGLTPPSPAAIAGACYIGLFEMGVTFFCWLRALSLARNPALPLNFVYLTPFLSLIWIRLIVGEIIHFTAILGLALIVAGILLQKSSTRLAGVTIERDT